MRRGAPSFRLALLAVLQIAYFPQMGMAGDRPAVSVTFDITEPGYSRHFGPDEGGVEARAADLVARELSSRIRFLTFSRGTGGPYQLEVLLAEQQAGNIGSDLKEVGFHLALRGPEISGQNGPRHYVRYRSAEQFGLPIGTPEAFLLDLESAFAGIATADLVASLFAHVPIAHDAEFVVENPGSAGGVVGWVIPFGQTEICMDEGSRFALENELSHQILGPLRRTYTGMALPLIDPPPASPLASHRGRIFGWASGDTTLIADLESRPREAFVLKAVYVREYVFIGPSCVPEIPPDDALFSSPEGQP